MVDALLDVKGAASFLAIGERSLWRLVNAGDIAHVRVGRSVRFAPDDLKQFITQHRKGGKPIRGRK